MTIQTSSPFTFSLPATANKRAVTTRQIQFQSQHSQSVQTITSQHHTIVQKLDEFIEQSKDSGIAASTYNLKGYFQQLTTSYGGFNWIKKIAQRHKLEPSEASTLGHAESEIPQTNFEQEVSTTIANQKALIGELQKSRKNRTLIAYYIPLLKDNYMQLSAFYSDVLEKIGYKEIQRRLSQALDSKRSSPKS